MKLLSCLFTMSLVFANSVFAEAKYATEFKSPGKPSAPISIDYQPITKALYSGDSVDLNIRFKVGESARKLMVSTKASEQSGVSVSTITQAQPKLGSDNTTDWMSVKADLLQDGIHYIDVIATVEVNGERQFKTFAIPVVVGEANWDEYLKPDGELKTDASGRKLLVQKAQETIE